MPTSELILEEGVIYSNSKELHCKRIDYYARKDWYILKASTLYNCNFLNKNDSNNTAHYCAAVPVKKC
jgi:hypothetical protein